MHVLSGPLLGLIVIKIVNFVAKFRTEVKSLHKVACSLEVASCAVWVCKRTLCSQVSSQRICSLSELSGLQEFKSGLYCWKVLTQFNAHVPNRILNCGSFPIDKNLLKLRNLICISWDAPSPSSTGPSSVHCEVQEPPDCTHFARIEEGIIFFSPQHGTFPWLCFSTPGAAELSRLLSLSL